MDALTGSVGVGAPVYAGTPAPAPVKATPKVAPVQAPVASGVASPIMAPPTGPQNADQFGQELHTETEKYKSQLTEIHKDDTPEPRFSQADPMKGFASLGGVIGVFGSLLSKQPLVSALNASSSAMEALKQGNVEEYANKVKEWSLHRDYVMSVEQNIARQYNAILQDKKLTYQEKVAEQRALLAQTSMNARLAVAGGAHSLQVEKYMHSLQKEETAQIDKSRAEGIHIINAAATHMTQEAALQANLQMAEALRTGTFNAGMAADILSGKPAKPQSGSSGNGEFVSQIDAVKPGGTVILGAHTYSAVEAEKIKKTSPASADQLSPALHAGWVAYQQGIAKAGPAKPVAKVDTGSGYKPGQKVSMGEKVQIHGKQYRVAGLDDPANPDFEPIE